MSLSFSKEDKNQLASLTYLLENINGISWKFDLLKDKFTHVSSNAEKILGYKRDEWSDLNSWKSMIYYADRSDISSYCINETIKGSNHSMEYRMIKSDGSLIWVNDVVTVEKDENSCPISLYGIIVDITEKKETQLALEKEHNYLQSVIDSIPDSVMLINENYTIDLMNKAARKNLEQANIADSLKPKCYEVSHQRETPCESEAHPCPLEEAQRTKALQKVIHRHKDSDGYDKYVELTATPMFDKKGDFSGIIETTYDISGYMRELHELKEQSDLLDYRATHDGLTSLPNRELFLDRLNQNIKACGRKKCSVGVLYLDIDDFKAINDTLGHVYGDEVLKEFSKRVFSVVRETDTLARLGGDEFAIIMTDLQVDDAAALLGKKIISILNKPYRINDVDISLTSSIGIAIGDKNSNVEDLLHKADRAMYDAKESGKNQFKYYDA